MDIFYNLIYADGAYQSIDWLEKGCTAFALLK